MWIFLLSISKPCPVRYTPHQIITVVGLWSSLSLSFLLTGAQLHSTHPN